MERKGKIGLHVKDLPTSVYVENPVETELPISIKIEFDSKAGKGKVSGRIQLNFDLGILTSTPFEINNVKKEVKRKLTEEFLKLAFQEVERKVANVPSVTKCFVTYAVKEDTKLLIVHPKGYAKLRNQDLR